MKSSSTNFLQDDFAEEEIGVILSKNIFVQEENWCHFVEEEIGAITFRCHS